MHDMTAPTPSSSATIMNKNNQNDQLLEIIQSLVLQEQKLTNLLTKHKPLLTLPTPRTLSDVDEILALARTYSTRTSAPPGWNPNLPVVHFATPNPLPHQLRQGALGALQLTLAREERRRKRRRIQEEKEKKVQLELEAKNQSSMAKGNESPDPKLKEVEDRYRLEQETKRRMRKERKDRHQEQRLHPHSKELEKNKPAATMNLSDSSSSSGSEASDESDDDSMGEEN